MSEHTSRIIYSQRLAGYLMLRGFVLLRMDKNAKFPTRNIFIFKDTPTLNEAVEAYINNK